MDFPTLEGPKLLEADYLVGVNSAAAIVHAAEMIRLLFPAHSSPRSDAKLARGWWHSIKSLPHIAGSAENQHRVQTTPN